MDETERKDCWDITVIQRVRHRVCFNQELTKEEAENAYSYGDYEDIIDFEFLDNGDSAEAE